MKWVRGTELAIAPFGQPCFSRAPEVALSVVTVSVVADADHVPGM
jgi:hypothetical protein